jgi:hypothetical protein
MSKACAMYGEKRNAQSVVVENPEGKRPLEDLGVGGSIRLKQISQVWDGSTYTRFIWLWIETQVAGSCDHGKKDLRMP